MPAIATHFEASSDRLHRQSGGLRQGDRAVGAEALEAWRQVLGAEHVLADDSARDRLSRTTGTSSTRPLAVLRPDSTEEVQEIVRIASRFGVALYPISRGRNWGYGDACAPQSGAAIVDLGRMNRILELDLELGYVVIEPGVTQGQLSDHLRQNGTGLWADVTGAGREASLVGNTLDRGFGHTPYGDHVEHTCGMDVVLADGRILRTGFGHYENAKAARVYRYGVGPSLDGLFCQSGLGIVTRIGLWLMPEPERFQAFVITVSKDEDLEDLIDRLARLRREGVLCSSVHVFNDLRLISGRTRYPWERAEGQTPLPTELRAELRLEHGVGAWNVAGALYGTRETVSAARRALKRMLGGGYRPLFLDDARLRRLDQVRRVLGWFGLGSSLGEKIASARMLVEILQGIPNDGALPGASWRVRGDDPPAERSSIGAHAGLMWVSPMLPARGRDARAVVNLLEPIYTRFGFESLVSFTLITPRAMCCITNLAFDKRIPEEVARAGACYDALMQVLMDSGYVPYRTSPRGVKVLQQGSQVFWEVTRTLKEALDPQGIISPGRYQPPTPLSSPATSSALSRPRPSRRLSSRSERRRSPLQESS